MATFTATFTAVVNDSEGKLTVEVSPAGMLTKAAQGSMAREAVAAYEGRYRQLRLGKAKFDSEADSMTFEVEDM
jgi:hypothetical protein